MISAKRLVSYARMRFRGLRADYLNYCATQRYNEMIRAKFGIDKPSNKPFDPGERSRRTENMLRIRLLYAYIKMRWYRLRGDWRHYHQAEARRETVRAQIGLTPSPIWTPWGECWNLGEMIVLWYKHEKERRGRQ